MSAPASPFSLAGKRALVTGANTGIGQGIAYALAEAGAEVIAAGRSSMDETASMIAAAGGVCHPLKVEVFRPKAPPAGWSPPARNGYAGGHGA